jgi:hypothetical protein
MHYFQGGRMRWHLIAIAVGAIVMALFYFPVPAPLTSDQDILNRVKQAGLWEMPVGDELAARGQAARVRDVGAKISAEHHQLDRITIDAAAELGAELPTEPTVDQRFWIAEVRHATTEDIDRIAINRLRAAHGKVLPLLAQVKVGTRDPIIREFVTESMVYVSRHITYLESTGLVDFSALPESDTVPPTLTLSSFVNYLGWGIVGVALIWWTYRRIYQNKRSVAQHRRK